MSIQHPTPDGGGFVPRLGADPSTARYELLTAAHAVERVAAVGFDPTDARQMVAQYLAQNIATFGPGPGDGWRVDPYDLAEIARAYEWVDHFRGETIADARARAAGYATDYQQRAAKVDREQDPGYAARLDREAAEWAERARDGHNPWPAPDPRMPTADGVIGDRTEVEEQSAVEAVSDALEDVEPRTAEQDTRSALVESAYWALGDRDAAIEQGATEHATRFAQQAREAIAAAEAAGITREQLAAELDYPGGAAELDGEHVDLAVTHGTPLSAATLAAWAAVDDDPAVAAEHAAAWTQRAARMTAAGQHTAAQLAGEEADRWATRARGESEAATPATGSTTETDTDRDRDGDGDGDGGVRGPYTGPPPVPLDGPDAARPDDHTGGGRAEAGAVAWWEPVDPEFTLTREEVVSELTHRGMTADQAAAAVTRYLDETSREIGVPVHRWGMDSHDIDAITHTHAAVLTGRPEADPWVQATGPDLGAAAQVGSDREDGGPVSDGRGPALPGDAPDSAVHRPDLDAIAAERRVAAARDAVAQATAPARTSRHAEGDAEQDRRSQLAAWAHDDDTSTDGAEHGKELQR